MRFDKTIYLQKVIPGYYDANTGDYSDDEVDEIKACANITNTGDYALNLIYGNIIQRSLTVRVQGIYAGINRIRIGNKFYRIDKSRPLSNKQTFVVSEVP